MNVAMSYDEEKERVVEDSTSQLTTSRLEVAIGGGKPAAGSRVLVAEYARLVPE
jgi:hypothetical protein